MAKSTDADDVPAAGTGTDEVEDVEDSDEVEDDVEVEDPDEAEDEEDEEDDDEDLPVRSEATDELWEELGVQPIKVALPREVVGYTLRAYRPAGELTPTDTAAAEPEEDPFAERERARAAAEAEEAAEAELDDEEPDELAEEELEPEDLEEEADEPEKDAEEEVPVFLSHQGKLLLFATPEALVSFVGSQAANDLAQLDTWPTLVKRVRPDDIVPTDEDTYELDLVVENLRGGHDAWNLPLLISAGEVARDLGYALKLEPVVTALGSGSPLDDLDDAVRAAAGGGFSGIFARRRLKRIGAQQASLGWRTVIGKISDAVDWRD